ncbi:helix-turn-helix domain-containing protein [Sphingobacterium corticibacter]|uniref:AraC family transcriptional regulator n=1 Tax=Sphingobacterium corticibacter TaxID=2171749 RepID=A0A2T8HFS7_9SPHI|nr:AraC family transcriptional regulator [Sphingobacterium corticibacter]PVH24250.1 AraC family transcriptional regulator [Sphingobacterium corticibacter]
MEVKIYDRNSQDLLVEKAYPSWHVPTHQGVIDQTTSWHHLGEDTSYREIYFDGIHIGFGRALVPHIKRFDVHSDVETVEMHFALQGMKSAKADQFHKPVAFASNQHNILFAKGLQADMQWEADEFQSCEINFSPELFKKYLPEGNTLFDRFRNNIEKECSQLLAQENRLISHQMHQLLQNIWNCDAQGIFKRLYLEHKVIELLMLQLEQFVKGTKLALSIKKSDADKMHAVRDFITSHLDAESSLTDLAKMVGTNEYTLKKGFKELFGTSVFAFWSDLKLQRAKELLLDQDRTVYEVAFLTGYSSTRHFGTAFKRKFGVSPAKIRRPFQDY